MALRSQIKIENLLAWLEVTSNSAKRKACEPSPRGATLSPALPYPVQAARLPPGLLARPRAAL